MPHIQPSQIALHEELSHLEQDYLDLKGNNEERKKLIRLVASFQQTRHEKYDHYAALGICFYGMLILNNEYRVLSVERCKLFGLLKKCLNTPAINAITDYEAVVYLFHLYQQLKKYPRKIDGSRTVKAEDTTWLLHKIEFFLKDYFSRILKNPPSYKSLQNNFVTIAEEYKPKKTYFGFGKVDVTRDQDIKRIRIMDDVLNQMCPPDCLDEKIKERVYKIRYGALLYMMSKIEDTYRMRSPENSSLYKLCQRVSCLKNTSFLNDNIKQEYYNSYIEFIATIQYNLRWKNAGLETADYMDKEWKRITSQSYLQRYSFYLMDYAARYGVQIAVGTVAATLLSQFKLTGIVISNSVQLLAPEYAMIANNLAPIIGDQLNSCVVSIISGVVSQILIEPIGKPMILITFSSTKSLCNFLSNVSQGKKSLIPQTHHVDQEFYKILDEMPANILSVEDKEKVQQIIGYDSPKKLLDKYVYGLKN